MKQFIQLIFCKSRFDKLHLAQSVFTGQDSVEFGYHNAAYSNKVKARSHFLFFIFFLKKFLIEIELHYLPACKGTAKLLFTFIVLPGIQVVKYKLQCLKGYSNKTSLGYIIRSVSKRKKWKLRRKKKRKGGWKWRGSQGKKNKGKQSTKQNKSNCITGHFIENTSYRTWQTSCSLRKPSKRSLVWDPDEEIWAQGLMVCLLLTCCRDCMTGFLTHLQEMCCLL